MSGWSEAAPAAPVRPPLSRALLSTLLMGLLLTPGLFAHEPAFGDGSGLRAAAWGAGLGLAIALAAGLARWRWWTTWGVAALAYLAFGGLAALPETTIAGGVPTGQSWQMLFVQLVTSWKDLLTLVPPASSFTGPAVLPYATGLLAGACSLSAALRGRRLLAVAPPALWYAIGAAWSVPYAPFALWWGLGFVALAAAWTALAAGWERRDRGEEIVAGDAARAAQEREGAILTVTGTRVRSQRRRLHIARSPWRRAAGVLGTIGLGVLIAALAVPAWLDGRPRTVLRQYVAPPLEVHDLPTPLERFRQLSADLVDEEIMRVTGLPQGARIRFAAMDEYDGLRWGVAEPSGEGAGFIQIGETISPPAFLPPGSAEYAAEVTLTQPISGWVPGIGRTGRISMGDGAVAGSLFYDGELRTLLTTTQPPGGVRYSLSGWNEPKWSEAQLAGRPLGPAQQPEPQRVPESISSLATSATATATTPVDRLRALERYFRDSGYFANGLQHPSAPGHGLSRISELIDGARMIGDDEQYATAMALAALSLGMPARVVMGAYPEEHGEGEIVLRGSDVHAWVEVQFEGIGWVPFDPTPPKDQTPQTEVPQPQSVPQPQVLQPPDPPQEPPRLPSDGEDDAHDDPYKPPARFPWLQIAGGTLLGLLVFLPLLGVPAWKWWRRHRRRRALGREGIRSAWREAVDYARDAGFDVPAAGTVMEGAEAFEQHRPLGGTAVSFASLVGAAEFSGRAVDDAQLAAAWEAEARLRASMQPEGWWARHRVRMSWRTLPLPDISRLWRVSPVTRLRGGVRRILVAGRGRVRGAGG